METNYAIIQIQRYLRGELSAEEMHALEREALDDPFLQEAFEGYSTYEDVPQGHLSLLQQRLIARTERTKRDRDHLFFGTQRLGIAATACVLFLLGCMLYLMRTHLFTQTTTEKTVEVHLKEGSIMSLLPSTEFPMIEGYDAEPIGGWEALNTHLQKQPLPSVVAGSYTVYFAIDPKGFPTQLVMEGATETVRDQLQQILTKGPRWEGKKGGFKIELSP
jgi:hypothetical protein